MLLLRPDEFTTNAVGYILAVVAKRHGILVHAVIVMSNHWHFVITDPYGNICEFTEECHATIANNQNAHYKDKGKFWSGEQTCHVTCEEPASTIDKMAYTMANPTAAFLVPYGHQWPGLRGAWGVTRTKRYRRPHGYFGKNVNETRWPKEVELEFARPPGYDHLSDDELAKMIADATYEKEEAARQEAKRLGITFLGRREVLRQNRYSTPADVEITGIVSEDGEFLGFRRKKNRGRMRRRRRKGQNSGRGKIIPRVACKNKWRRIECLQRNRAWLEAYKRALERWRLGDRDVEFPYGTYKLRILAGVNVAPP